MVVLVALAIWTGAFNPSAAETAARPPVPSYWNPDAKPEKPDTAGIGAIRFTTTDDYPPFGFVLQDGAPAGFEVDLARAICDELQVTCTIQARPWENILPALKSDQADAAIASLAITNTGPSDIAFTRPYYKTPARFVVRQTDTSDDPADWKDKRIAVIGATAQAAYLRRFFPNNVAVDFSSADLAHAALKSSAVDAMFSDAVGASIWLNGSEAGACCRFAGGAYTEEQYFGQGAGIAVRSKDVELRRALDYALARVAAKGTYGDIYLRYFPLGLY